MVGLKLPYCNIQILFWTQYHTHGKYPCCLYYIIPSPPTPTFFCTVKVQVKSVNYDRGPYHETSVQSFCFEHDKACRSMCSSKRQNIFSKLQNYSFNITTRVTRISFTCLFVCLFFLEWLFLQMPGVPLHALLAGRSKGMIAFCASLN